MWVPRALALLLCSTLLAASGGEAGIVEKPALVADERLALHRRIELSGIANSNELYVLEIDGWSCKGILHCSRVLRSVSRATF